VLETSGYTRCPAIRLRRDGWVLKHRLRPVRGLPPDQATQVIADTRPAFMQNLRRGHYEIASQVHGTKRDRALTELALAI
jgi:hypothetical protein